MSALKEFKDFAIKGNLVDIAVAFVMGAAFNKVVSGFTGGIVAPLIGLIFKADFKSLKYVLSEAKLDEAGKVLAPENAILYGEFITYVIDFIIVAAVMFAVVKAVAAAKKKEEPAPEAPKGPTQEELLVEIRDLLKK